MGDKVIFMVNFTEKNKLGGVINYDDPSTWDKHPTKPWLVVYPPNYLNYRGLKTIDQRAHLNRPKRGESLAKLVQKVLDERFTDLHNPDDTGEVHTVTLKEAIVIVAAHKAVKMGDNDMIKWLASMYDTGAGSSVSIKKSLGETELAILQKAGISVEGFGQKTIEHEPTPILDI